MTLNLVAHRVPGVRKYALALAMLLACGSCWLLIPEVLRLAGSPRPAAQTAFFRGELWTELALNEAGQAARADGLDAVQSVALRSVKLAPLQARMWLLLADLNARSAPEKSAGFLKLSYYTAPADDELIPRYLSLLARFDLSDDDELQYLMERQIQKILLRHPELRPDLIAAYRRTSLKNQMFIRSTSIRFAPAFGVELDRQSP